MKRIAPIASHEEAISRVKRSSAPTWLGQDPPARLHSVGRRPTGGGTFQGSSASRRASRRGATSRLRTFARGAGTNSSPGWDQSIPALSRVSASTSMPSVRRWRAISACRLPVCVLRHVRSMGWSTSCSMRQPATGQSPRTTTVRPFGADHAPTRRLLCRIGANATPHAGCDAVAAVVSSACSAGMRSRERNDRRCSAKARFWLRHQGVLVNARQRKAINVLLDAGPGGFAGGMNTRKYVGLTRASRATAYRELADLVEKGCLVASGAGRSVSYQIRWR